MPQAPDLVTSLVLGGVGATDIGRRRKYNEDVLLIREDLQLFVVADGAGGHEAGNVAAELAVRSVANYIEATESEARDAPEFDRFGLPSGARRLSLGLHKANHDVHEISAQYQKTRGMGTTLVSLLFSPRCALAHIAHAGDSRCYRFRQGHLELLTQDHSLLTDVLEERPDIEDRVLDSLPKHVVTRALGMQSKIRASVNSHEVLPGDRYLLCSDGLSGYVPSPRIAEILGDARPPGAIVQLLINAANDAGGHDNISALIVDSSPEPATASTARTRERLDAEQRAAIERNSEPELLLLGIEDVDLREQIQALLGRDVGGSERPAASKPAPRKRRP